jgi:polyphosphate kinase 2 (PPK2 family)
MDKNTGAKAQLEADDEVTAKDDAAPHNAFDEVAEHPSHLHGEMRHSHDKIRDLFRNGTYPYKTRIRTSVYEQHKNELQVELLKVQNWVKMTGQRVVVLMEGRDAAGKGGTIKRFMEHLNPRAALSC